MRGIKGGFGQPKPLPLGGAHLPRASSKPLFNGLKQPKMPAPKMPTSGGSHMSSASHDQFMQNVPGWTKEGF